VAQLNPTVGDIEGNVASILSAMDQAEARGADVLLTPELSIPGYPPEDLLERADFVAAQAEVLGVLAEHSGQVITLVGFAEAGTGPGVDSRERGVYNAVALLGDGQVLAVERKSKLPTYSVFDESRWFIPADISDAVYDIAGHKVAVMICEDLWSNECVRARTQAGAEVVLSVNASPWFRQKESVRSQVALAAGIPVVYCNQMGGQDGIVYDGGSFAVMGAEEIWRAGSFVESFSDFIMFLDGEGARDGRQEQALFATGRPALVGSADIVDVVEDAARVGNKGSQDSDRVDHDTWDALCLGLCDYVGKNGFEGVWLGLSGGVDSAVVAALAVDALGAERVTGVLMPSAHSSEGSVTDAYELAKRLGVETIMLPIVGPNDAILAVLAGGNDSTVKLGGAGGIELTSDHPFALSPGFGVAEENIQARIRGLYVMALSNKFGGIVLTTGNKSEVACGYSTLYGDACGGLACLSDVPKTLVYRLAHWRNRVVRGGITSPIPDNILTKPPSAELAPGQQDSDSLPPYELLDYILDLYVDNSVGPGEIVERLCSEGDSELVERCVPRYGDQGVSAVEEVVARVVGLVDRAEYKRRQMAPGLKITPRAFGRDRQLPITNGWAGWRRR
jgi:NAD+ synthase (glutamine-hydrolysing)